MSQGKIFKQGYTAIVRLGNDFSFYGYGHTLNTAYRVYGIELLHRAQ